MIGRPPRRALAAYALALIVVVLDQATKAWILTVPEHVSIDLVWPLQLTRIWNNGISFGLLQMGHEAVRWGMTIFNLGVAAVLATWAWKRVRPALAMGFGFLIGGAIGNAIDRVRLGAVVDFIDVTRLGFFPWIFNVADAAITVGVLFLIWDMLRPESPATSDAV